ncbi:hypothetical protein LOTGIDRAFT_161344 [Lottia gigantea]|uniref:Uncharacterized protein n=1 Tax=Lottia gigantea TaxID=225164 RepID=V4BYD8_LOTGI|nr:hypothetical protein LOTGIDRAFT_161344 [Lottia gigantea]ESO94144.1 hypothetical protein LOTGIDRAFT_161344 [Lottia gigantea]
MADSGSEKDILSNLNKDFKKSKAEQILRLLKDQECLNQKFKEFALESDDSDVKTDDETGNLTESDESIEETERKLAETISLRRHSGVRCKTSMGFYNDIECDDDSGIASRDPSANPIHQHQRSSKSNPRRRMYTPREDKLDLSDTEPDEQVIESARAPSRSKGGYGIRYELSLLKATQDPEPPNPIVNDSYIRRRPRLSSAKIEPLGRKTPIRSFCEGREGLEDVTYKTYSPLPPRSFTPQTFTPIGAVSSSELHPSRLLNRSSTLVDRGLRSGCYVPKSRPFTPTEAALHDTRASPVTRPRRKLPDIAKAKALTVMKLPPLESNKSLSGREFIVVL